ncbi:MAG: type VI secretion system tip protein TssI/VgrG [Byssovorax sp.]
MNFDFDSETTGLQACRSVSGSERLGEPSRFEIEIVLAEAIDPAAVLGAKAALRLTNAFGERRIHGLSTRVTQIATSRGGPGRIYRITLTSALHPLSLRRRARVFQHLTVPAIVKRVLEDGGHAANRIAIRTADDHPEREYLVQYDETDLDFVRRLCEEDGLFYRFEAGDGADTFVLEDAASSPPPALETTLPLADAAHLAAPRPTAFSCEVVRGRRPGKVRLRDHDPQNPALALENVANGGGEAESAIEVYAAPGRFKTSTEGEMRARVHLESLRADASVVRFSTTAPTLAPGLSVMLEPTADLAGTARPEGSHRVLAVEHAWKSDDPRGPRITAIAADVPYRLERRTPRPRIHGLHPAIVTGAPGEEIHTDGAAHVRIRFFWDREGPDDDKSSLPVRVLQNNLPGSMLIPRVGWEVVVAFEDGDPDRPYVLGRAYNARLPPPFALPANKTITSLATVSSPGGARPSSVHFDDAKGRQHLAWAAGFGKTTTVANNMLTQTVGFEQTRVGGAQTWKIGGNESISVTNASIHDLGSQSAHVGGTQDIGVKGNSLLKVGSEKVAVGGALIEQVGTPGQVTGALKKEGALFVAGELLSDKIPLAYSLYTAAQDVHDVYAHSGGNTTTAGKAALQHLLGLAESHVPGLDAVIGAAGASKKAPWDNEDVQKAREAAAAGGGAGGAGAQGAGSGGGAGNRETVVNGAMMETVDGVLMIAAATGVKSTTAGGAVLIVGGSNLTRATKVSHLYMGISSESAASIAVEAGIIGRNVKGALTTHVGGALAITAGGAYELKAGSLALKVGGALSATGGTVTFRCGGSELVASPGGVLIKAASVKVTKIVKISGKQAVG